MLAAKIVYEILDELADRSGCCIEEVIDDVTVYEELLDDLIAKVSDVLEDAVTGMLRDRG